MPFYVIEPKKPEDATKLRIVQAKNQAQALSHVVEDTLIIRSAEPADYMALAKASGEIEKAE